MEVAILCITLANLISTAMLVGVVVIGKRWEKHEDKSEARAQRDKMDEGFENIMNFSVDVHSGAEME